jgi:lysyl-tRNA synthetase class 2
MDRETARLRARIIQGIRSFFTEKGYLEVETPALSSALIPEAPIEVFKAPYLSPNGGGRDFFLIPSPEVHMKRLIKAGFGNIFQICKAFRNGEQIGNQHNPEFTMLEWYTMGADYRGSLDLTRGLLDHLRRFCALPENSDYQEITVKEAFERFAGIDLDACLDLADFKAEAKRAGEDPSEDGTWEEVYNRVFVSRVEPRLAENSQIFVTDYPDQVPCLAKKKPGSPWRERWELYLGGMEAANCFSEETDPAAVSAFFAAEEKKKREGALVPHPVDKNFLEGFLTGFPPCSGVAMGVDRLVMGLLGKRTIEGVIFFPFSDIVP